MSDETTPRVFTSGERDTLIALVEQGPVWDGDVPSKEDRDRLIAEGYASRIIHEFSYGWTAATYKGAHAYLAMFPGSSSLGEAKAARLFNATMRRM